MAPVASMVVRPVNVFVETAAIVRPVMPTDRTASRFDSEIDHTAVYDDDVVGLGPQRPHGYSGQERAEAEPGSLLPGEVAHGRER